MASVRTSRPMQTTHSFSATANPTTLHHCVVIYRSELVWMVSHSGWAPIRIHVECASTTSSPSTYRPADCPVDLSRSMQ